MPDLTQGPYSYIAANYRRAENKFSNFGTRRLRFYSIEIEGYDILANEDNSDPDSRYDWNFGTTDDANGGYRDDYYYGYKSQPKSIIEAILRGVSLVAEIYYVSWWAIEYDGDYPYLYITVAVAGDTFLDGNNQDVQSNGNAYSMQNAIADALGNDYYWDQIFVWPNEINGDHMNQANAPYALPREKVQVSEARKAERAARIADPKTAKVSRRG